MNPIKPFVFIFFLIPLACLQAQGPVEAVLQEIEKNNTTLAALRSGVEAEKLGNRTGIFLADPQVDLFLLNKSDENLRRTNFGLVQPLDIPTLLGRRNQLAQAMNQQLDYRYLEQRQQVLLEAHLLVIDLIYHNALALELEKRLQHASEIARSYQTMLDAGEVNILEHNKARLNLFNARKALELNEIERRSLSNELQALNGGKAIAVDEREFPIAVLPPDFQQWVQGAFDANPVFRSLGQELVISRSEERLAKAAYWPEFSAGYMMEALPAERFSGFGMGISIPLWENRNTIRHARLKSIAIQQHNDDLSLRYLNHYRGLYDQAKALQESSLDNYRVISSFDNAALLIKALNAGQISLIEYMLELGFYYDAVDLSLETERQLQKVLARMERFAR